MRYAAFLRAVNVGGRVVKMDRLRGLFSEMGFSEVTTHIASGNVLFSAGRAAATSLGRRIEAALGQALGYDVATFLRSPAELAAVARHAAFDGTAEGTAHASYVGFLKEPLDEEQERLVRSLETPNDALAVRGREVYWLCRERSLKSIGSPGRIEKALGLTTTFRNVTTVRQVAALLSAGG